MNDKGKIEKYMKVSTIVVITILVVAATLSAMSIGGLQSDPQAWAQTAPTSNANTQAPIVQQGIVTSSEDPLPGHEAHQSATILRLRNDNAVYSGILTFTANKPVEVQILHTNLNNSIRSVPEEFGAFNILPLPTGQSTVTISNVLLAFPGAEDATTFAASIPFSGNAIALHNIGGEPFAATYTITADIVGQAERADDIGQVPSTTTATATETANEDEEGEEEVDSEDN